MPPSEDEISLGNDEFGVPEDPVEQDIQDQSTDREDVP